MVPDLAVVMADLTPPLTKLVAPSVAMSAAPKTAIRPAKGSLPK